MKTKAKLIGLTVIALASGCSTVPDVYKPNAVGYVNGSVTEKGLQVTIRPARDQVAVGDVINFDVIYENVGDKPFMFPKNPNLLFTWTYSNGRRDNYLGEDASPKHYDATELVSLKPGTCMTSEFPVKTYYFKTQGVTEFRAILRCPLCTNPELSSVWHGRAVSNTYGVMLTRGQDYASL